MPVSLYSPPLTPGAVSLCCWRCALQRCFRLIPRVYMSPSECIFSPALELLMPRTVRWPRSPATPAAHPRGLWGHHSANSHLKTDWDHRNKPQWKVDCWPAAPSPFPWPGNLGALRVDSKLEGSVLNARGALTIHGPSSVLLQQKNIQLFCIGMTLHCTGQLWRIVGWNWFVLCFEN